MSEVDFSHACSGADCKLCAAISEIEQLKNELARIAALEKENKELSDYKADVENATKCAMDEKCDCDERHCSCVPLLRAEVERLKELNEELTKDNEGARSYARDMEAAEKEACQRIAELEKATSTVSSTPEYSVQERRILAALVDVKKISLREMHEKFCSVAVFTALQKLRRKSLRPESGEYTVGMHVVEVLFA